MTTLDFNVVETEPGRGEAHTFSPPAGFTGDGDAYRRLMRTRFKDHMFRQRMAGIARFARAAGMPAIRGPFAKEARDIIGRLMPPPRSTSENRA